MSTTPSSRTLACLFVACASHAQAQDPDVTSLPEVKVQATAQPNVGYQTKESSVATKGNVAVRDVPQTVNAVPAELMRDQNAMSVQDALQNVPGLSFSVGDAQRDQVFIRGFTAINDQFVDGVRDDALYYRDLSNIERVEVLKGPASVLYGRGSAGGMVNRVTKKPGAHPVQEIGVTLGARGQKRAEFDTGFANADGTLMLRMTGALEDSTSFRDQFFLKRQAWAPSLTYKPNALTSFTAQLDYLDDKRLADQGVPSYRGRPVNVPIHTYFGAANGRDRAFVQSKVLGSTLTLDHRFNDALSFRSVLRGYDFELDRNYTTIAKVTDGAKPSVTIAQTRRLRNERGFFWQNELSHHLRWGGVEHQLLYGLELGRQNKSEWLTSRGNAATYALFAPVLADLPPMPANAKPSVHNATRVNVAAAYVQDLMTLSPNWKVLAGLRYERLAQFRDDLTAANKDLHRVDTPLSPRVGLIYQTNDRLSLYAAYSRSFQPLSDSYVFYGNSDQLKPTLTRNREIGIKYEISPRASLSAAIFDMSQNNIQVGDPERPGFALNVGQQRTRGLELSVSGELARGWDVMAGYAYMRGVIARSTEKTSANTPFKGNVSALTPRHTFNLWLKHRLGNGYWVAGGGRAESARFASADNLTRLAGYGVMNLAAGYEGRHFDVTVSLKNVLDRRYTVSAHGGANDYNMPGEPRSLIVAARYRF
ncbi:TonB-dependent receptor [Ottowia testudinis]|uniref:TonB-dependent siderophore receptor n=1 Tax=Ottowia testudinis TaxID=2816950 RepID=A0A975H771_9BURK|nr:TonB-dependent siderophore receptor [Ottowia testudinis]QTD46727.1 TonB-dependent siderophore receptor [Ottowia testudinis]